MSLAESHRPHALTTRSVNDDRAISRTRRVSKDGNLLAVIGGLAVRNNLFQMPGRFSLSAPPSQ